MKREALTLIRLGYRVLPLAPGSKRPHPVLAPSGLKNATQDPKEAASWWEKAPEAGLGLLPPEEVLVLDADSEEALQGLIATFRLGHAPRVRTPRGGGHIYLRLPRGLSLPARAGALPGVDLRGMGRAYLVAPPTEIGGRAYRYEVPLQPKDRLPLAPTALLKALPKEEGPPSPPPVVGDPSPKRLRGLLESYARKVAQAPVGTRHATLLRYSLAAGGLIPHGLSPDLAWSVLLEAGLASGLPRGEVAATLRWGLERGAKAPIPLVDRPIAGRR